MDSIDTMQGNQDLSDENEFTEEQHFNEEEIEDNTDNTTVVKVRKVVRKPQPKLNAELLKGNRGLTALPKCFKNIKLKGQGYEEEDLTCILRTYEYWCHRMFPKYPFDECINRLEKLGTSKNVVTTIKKIRTGLIEPELEMYVNRQNDEIEWNEHANISGTTPYDEPLNIMPIPELSDDVRKRIAENKERALQLRAQRLSEIHERANSKLSKPI